MATASDKRPVTEAPQTSSSQPDAREDAHPGRQQGRREEPQDGWLYLDRARAELADAVIRFHAAGMRLAGDRCDRILNAVETLLNHGGRDEAPRPTNY